MGTWRAEFGSHRKHPRLIVRIAIVLIWAALSPIGLVQAAMVGASSIDHYRRAARESISRGQKPCFECGEPGHPYLYTNSKGKAEYYYFCDEHVPRQAIGGLTPTKPDYGMLVAGVLLSTLFGLVLPVLSAIDYDTKTSSWKGLSGWPSWIFVTCLGWAVTAMFYAVLRV